MIVICTYIHIDNNNMTTIHIIVDNFTLQLFYKSISLILSERYFYSIDGNITSYSVAAYVHNPLNLVRRISLSAKKEVGEPLTGTSARHG